MNRKKFIQTLGGGTLALTLAPQLLLAGGSGMAVPEGGTRLTILHTNDQHSRIEPFDASYARNPNQGGFARRATLIQKIRAEEQNVLLLDAGDVFQGTPYFNFFGGELEFKLMSMMGYDASTMGNHEFDNRLDGFKKALPHAKFPFICSNYDFSNTILDGLTEKYRIFRKGGIKIGIFGVGIELAGLVGKTHYGETVHLNAIETAQEYTRILREDKKCDLVICLSHIGYDYRDNPNKVSDRILAANTDGIDLILGGHTHTFLKEPQQLTNKAGKTVLVNQVGWAGLLLGRIDFKFDRLRKVQNITWQNQAINANIIA